MQAAAVELKDLLQTADWHTEKHVPVIEAPESVKKGQMFAVTVTIGKEIAHPNTTQHHIAWIELYFMPRGEKFPYQIGKLSFDAHGSSVDGADTSTVYTHHGGTLNLKTDKPGTLIASSYCNIHGLWQNSKDISVQ